MSIAMVVVRPNVLFDQMLMSAVKQGHASEDSWGRFNHISLDPGETTGVCWRPAHPFTDAPLAIGQISTGDLEFGADNLDSWMSECLEQNVHPTIVTMEDYKVYSWKADSHKWAGLHTPQLIGSIRRFVHSRRAHISLRTRMAQQAKGFATDDNLKKWGIYEPGMKHGRDAERHLITTMFFGATQK